jgi:hypothetical protein
LRVAAIAALLGIWFVDLASSARLRTQQEHVLVGKSWVGYELFVDQDEIKGSPQGTRAKRAFAKPS